MPSLSLPARPSLDHLKRQAKELLAAFKAGDPDTVRRVRVYFSSADPSVRLSVAQLVIAREYGFESWNRLRRHVELHSGDADLVASADRLVESAVGIETRDAMPAVRALLAERPAVATATLAAACATGSVDAVRGLLDADPAAVSTVAPPKGWAPLLYVAYSGFLRDPAHRPGLLATARLLLDRGADPNTAWTNRWNDEDVRETAIYGATGVNDCPVLAEMLLKAGADPNDGESLYHSAELPEPTCLKLLMEHGGDIRQMNALARLLDFERPEWVRMMLSYVADPSHIPPVLPHALRRGRSAAVFAELIASGMDLNTPSDDGRTPYQIAARLGRTDVTDLLAAAGADTTLTPADALFARLARGETVAPTEFTPGMVCGLDAEKPTPTLVVLAESGADVALDTLLAAGVNPNVSDQNGWTPLHHAALGGRLATVRILLRHGADVTIRDKVHNGNAIGFACARSVYHAGADQAACVQIVNVLADAGTPLPETAWGSPEVQAALIARGAKAP